VRNTGARTQDAGLWRDLAALRRYAWLPLASLALAVIAALVIGAMRSGSGEARFRENVVVDALPPLFGPPVLPSPFDYARLATSDGVVAAAAQTAGVDPAALKPRLSAQARFNSTDIWFAVTGPNALAAARAWRQAFADAAAAQTPVIERLLVQSYARQLDEAQAVLQARDAAAKVSPDDAVAAQQLKAAQENYETASKLSQSYDVVSKTMKAASFAVETPHLRGAGVGSTAGRLGAAVAIGLLAGVVGAFALDWASRRRRTPDLPEGEEAPAAFRRKTTAR
jgi:hypothetical protein